MRVLDSYLEMKIAISQIVLVVTGTIIAVGFTFGAFTTGQWLWLVAVPMNIVGVATVVSGGLRRHRTRNASGTAISVGGGLLIVGSIWAAFLLGNAFPV